MNLGEQRRHPGCTAELIDNGVDVFRVPVCMGGAAVRGARASVNGCNLWSQCEKKLADDGAVSVIPVGIRAGAVSRVGSDVPSYRHNNIQIPTASDLISSGLY